MDQRILKIIQKHPELKSEFEEIYPELKESEDERIREMLIEQMECWHECALENNVVQDIKDSADAITWLEKQKTSEEAIRYVKENHSPDEVSDFQAAMNIAVAKAYDKGVQDTLKKQKEQKPSTPEDIAAAYQIGLAKGRNEQKSAEWSEEDEMNLYNIIEAIKYTYDVSDGSGGSRLITWLKSLRPLPQQNMLIGFMLYLDEHRPDGKMCLSNAECNQLEIAFRNQDWSTILKYAEKYLPHWKPSEEHSQGLPKVTISRGKF